MPEEHVFSLCIFKVPAFPLPTSWKLKGDPAFSDGSFEVSRNRDYSNIKKRSTLKGTDAIELPPNDVTTPNYTYMMLFSR